MKNSSQKEDLIKVIGRTLDDDQRVVFAYLYGSAVDEDASYHDIDIAVYAADQTEPHRLSADLKIALHKRTRLPADFFDIRIINDILKTGNAYSFIFLKNVFSANHMLVDKNREIRTDFLEAYAIKYRECEGFIQEVVG